jgi:pimeloyl-ACP methyl ester carboxylesterase
MIRNVDGGWIESLTDTQKRIDGKPLLLVTASLDPVSIAQASIDNANRWVQNATIQSVEAGHWLQLEKPEQVLKFILEFVG